MERNFDAVFGIAATKVQGWFEKAIRMYIWGFIGLVIITVALIALGVRLNEADLKGGNFYIAAVFLVTWAFFTFYPACLATVFGLGGLSGLPEGWSLNQLIRQGVLPDLQVSEVVKQGATLIKRYAAWSAHLALFMVVVFVTLGTWDIENAGVVLPIFVVLAGIGLWTLLFTSKTKWYKRIVIGILLVSLAGLVYTGYVYRHPQDKTVDQILDAQIKNKDTKENAVLKNILEKVRNGTLLSSDEEKILAKARKNTLSLSTVNERVATIGHDLFYNVSVDKEVTSLQNLMVCGIQAGTRKFEVVPGGTVVINGENTNIRSALRINGALPNASFTVDQTECVVMSFAVSNDFKNYSFEPIMLTIKFN